MVTLVDVKDMQLWPRKSNEPPSKPFTESRRLRFEKRHHSIWGLIITAIAVLFAALTIYWLTEAKKAFEASQAATANSIVETRIAKANRDCRGAVDCFQATLRGSDLQEQFDSQVQNEIANWTFGLLIIAVLGACTSIVGLVWIRASLVAARHANEINSMAISNAERAWVFSEVHPEGHIQEVDGIDCINIRVEHKNFGKTAASNVRTNIGAASLDTVDEVMKRLVADNTKPSTAKYGLLIPPGDVRHRAWVWSSDETQGVKIDLSIDKASFIVGCVSYETMFDTDVHVSGFVYSVNVDSWGTLKFHPWAGSFAN